MNRLLTALVCLCAVVNGYAADQVPEGQKLALMVSVDAPGKVGDLVQLQDAQHCRYVGTLQYGNGQPESKIVALLNQANGNVVSWSIAVKSKTCGASQQDVALVVPLRNLVTQNGYSAGDEVLAYPAK